MTRPAHATDRAPRLRARPRDEQGYVLVIVLLLVGAISAMTATYSRHVVVSSRSASVAQPIVEGREACHSGLEFACRSLMVGEALSSASVSTSGRQAGVSVANLADGREAIRIATTTSDGLGATALAEIARVPVARTEDPDTLPTIPKATMVDLVADANVPRTHIMSDTRLQDTEITGLLVVHDSVVLTLDDVVIHGAIISEDVYDSTAFGAYDSLTAPRVVIDGNLRIDAGSFLPGVAVVLPDGGISTTATECSVQIDGDVVAHSVVLEQRGSLDGQVAAVSSSLGSSLDLVRYGRDPGLFGDGLQVDQAYDIGFVAMVPRLVTVADMQAAVDFWKELETNGTYADLAPSVKTGRYVEAEVDDDAESGEGDAQVGGDG